MEARRPVRRQLQKMAAWPGDMARRGGNGSSDRFPVGWDGGGGGSRGGSRITTVFCLVFNWGRGV